MTEQPNPVQIQKFLSGVDYPARKADLLSTAKEAGADRPALDALEALPEREYDGPTAVSEELSRD